MKLIRLHLKNYRKFHDVEIEFRRGITAIIGANGAGKSTIVEAIEWALYGSAGGAGRGDKKENIKRAGAGEGEICLVEFEFELRGERYRIKRWMKGKANTVGAELLFADTGHQIAEGGRDVSEEVEKLIGFGVKPFEVSVFAKQSELAALSNMIGSQRRELILRLLGIERIEDAISKAKEDKKTVDYEIKALEGALHDASSGRKYMDIKKEELANIRKEMENAKTEKESILKEKQRLEEEATALEKSVKELEERRKIYEELQREMSRVDARLNSSTREMERLRREIEATEEKMGELDKLRKDVEREAELRDALRKMSEEFERYRQMDSLKRQLKSMQEEMEQTNREIEKLEEGRENMDSLIKEIGEVEQKREETDKRLESLQSRHHQLLAGIERLEEEIEAVRTERERIEELGEDSECPTCHRPLKSHYRVLLTDFETKKEQLISRKEEMLKESKDTESRLEAERRLKKALDRRLSVLMGKKEAALENEKILKGRYSHRDTLMEGIKETEAKIAGIGAVNYDEKEMKRLRKEVDGLEKSVREFRLLEAEITRLPELRKRLEEERNERKREAEELESLKNEVEELGYDESSYTELAAKNRALNLKMRELEKRLGIEEGRLNTSKAREKDLLMAIEELKEKEAKKGDLVEKALYLSKTIEVLGDFKIKLMRRIRPLLSDFSSSLLREITEGKYPVIKFGENYEVMVLDENEMYPINRFSGGEKDLINLCIRLAISRSVSYFSGASEMNTIILDEVFGSQDEDRKRNILNTLNALRRDFSQIIVISHLEDVKESVNNVIRVIEDPVTRVSRVVAE